MSRPEQSYIQPTRVVKGTENLDKGRKVTVAAGTPILLSATSVPFHWLILQALVTNTNNVVVGGSTISLVAGSEGGTVLTPLSSLPYEDGNLNQIYVDSVTTGEGVSWQVNKK